MSAGVAATTTEGDPSTGGNMRPASRRRLIVPLLLLGLYAAQGLWFIATQSLTVDEPLHVFAGLVGWREHKFEYSIEHPPLLRLWMTLPLAKRGPMPVVVEDDNVTRLPDPVGLAWRTRIPILLLGMILGVLLWRAARRLWSEGAANLALALFAFSPSLIAHFSLATTDGGGVLMVFATALQLIRWRENPSRRQTLLLGLVLGLLLLSKLYAPAYFLLTIALVLVLKPGGWALSPLRWNWRAALLAVVVALLIGWAGYFFHVSHVTVRDGDMRIQSPHRAPVVVDAHGLANFNLWLPAGEYLEGMSALLDHNESGHRSFLLGRVSETGERMYFPVVILLKWPLTVLLLTVAAAVLLLLGKIALPRSLLVLLAYPALTLGMAMASHIDIGERHILQAYPFVLLFAAGAWQVVASSLRKPGAGLARGASITLVLLAALNAADALRYAPDYLSFFNVVISPAESYRYLSDSNLDWGQGLIALRNYQRRHPGEKIHLAYQGSVEPNWYGIRAEDLGEQQRTTGTVVVAASLLSGQWLANPNAYHWLLQYPRKAILNHTLYVFEVR